MKHSARSVLFAGLCIATALSASAHEMGKEEGKGDVTLKGEVVDLACYMGHGASGEKHKECAQACISKGMPMGLLTKDGQVFLLLEDHTNKDAYQNVKNWAAEQVKVMGDSSKKGGIQAIVVEKAEKS